VVRNALTHSPDGSVVEVACAISPHGVEVTCRDHGPGVPATQLERIFEPFVRLDTAAHSGRGGGLGLAIARQAARLHAGRIQARNHDQGGLCVSLVLPVA
jgi:signal transduction histidine kinase